MPKRGEWVENPQTIEDIMSNLQLSAWWIKKHKYYSVHFKKCVVCGDRFVSKTSKAKQCSQKCISKATNARMIDRRHIKYKYGL